MLAVGINHGNDNVGDEGLYVRLLKGEDEVLRDAYTGSKDWWRWMAEPAKTGERFTVEVVDEDTTFIGEFAGNIAWLGAQLCVLGNEAPEVLPQIQARMAGPEWEEMLPHIDTEQHGHAVNWVKDEQGLSQLNDKRVRQMLVLPIGVPDSYEMEVVFTKLSGSESMNFRFPVGNRNPSFTLAGFPHEGYASVIKTINDPQPNGKTNPTYVSAEALENNREYRFNLIVRVADGQAAIAASLDDEQIVAWSGEQHKVWHGYKAPYFSRTLAIVSFAGAVRFNSVRVRTLE